MRKHTPQSETTLPAEYPHHFASARKKLYRLTIFLGFLALLLLVANSWLLYQHFSSRAHAPFLVVTSTEMLADAVRQITDTHCVHVQALIPVGSDIHTFRAHPSTIALLWQADVILIHGLGAEGALARVLETYPYPERVWNTGSWFTRQDLLWEEDGQVPDPHVWNDVVLWRKMVDTLGKRLLARIPQNCQNSTRVRWLRYLQRLDTLHQWVHHQMQFIPREQRYLITPHASLAYFARRYGWETIPLQGVSSVSPLNPHHLRQALHLLRHHIVPCVFLEYGISVQVLKLLQERYPQTQFCGYLYTDGVGPPPANTYEGFIRWNIHQIVSAWRQVQDNTRQPAGTVSSASR